MPIYEYRCDSCDHQLEALQKISDAPLRECPQCETEGLRKLVSATAFRLSGSGWYETDFKQSNKRNLAGDSSKSQGGKSAAGQSDGGKGAKASGTTAANPA